MTDNFVPLPDFRAYPEAEMIERARWFHGEMRRRRTVRNFSGKPVAREVIEHGLAAAGTAPSGANLQPWHFVVIANAELKHRIRIAADAEERAFYARRATPAWLAALAPLGTDPNKPFLVVAPYLIAVFVQNWSERSDGTRMKHYYAADSVGIATGLLIAALHHAGLAILTQTPSPMGFLNQILERPKSEKPFVLLAIGFPSEDARVPNIARKSLDQIATWR